MNGSSDESPPVALSTETPRSVKLREFRTGRIALSLSPKPWSPYSPSTNRPPARESRTILSCAESVPPLVRLLGEAPGWVNPSMTTLSAWIIG